VVHVASWASSPVGRCTPGRIRIRGDFCVPHVIFDNRNSGPHASIGGWVKRGWVTKTNCFWQKRSPNCDFLVLHSPSTLSTSKNMWRVGPAWGVRWTRIGWEKFSIVFTPYSIDTSRNWPDMHLQRDRWEKFVVGWWAREDLVHWIVG
jgi:hypothetical protein